MVRQLDKWECRSSTNNPHILNRREFQNHAGMHILYARQAFSKADRWAAGAQMVNLYKSLMTLYESKVTPKGHFSDAGGVLSAGGNVRTMWVSKDTKEGIRRGQKVFVREAKEEFESRGVRFRTVRFPRRKPVRDMLSHCAKAMEPFHHERQFGFVSKKSCIDSANEHRFARTVMLIDLEDAFDQVSSAEVYQILRRVFLINSGAAHAITSFSTCKGYLYQGSPLAPALFNVRAIWCVERLYRLCEANNLKLSVYADDITISSSEWTYFSRGFQKTVNRIIAECGLKANARKFKVRRVSPLKIGGYDITGLAIDYDKYTGYPYVRPLHRKRTQNKANYIEWCIQHGMELSFEINKFNQRKKLELVQDGLQNWASARTKAEPPSNLDEALRLSVI